MNDWTAHISSHTLLWLQLPTLWWTQISFPIEVSLVGSRPMCFHLATEYYLLNSSQTSQPQKYQKKKKKKERNISVLPPLFKPPLPPGFTISVNGLTFKVRNLGITLESSCTHPHPDNYLLCLLHLHFIPGPYIVQPSASMLSWTSTPQTS